MSDAIREGKNRHNDVFNTIHMQARGSLAKAARMLGKAEGDFATKFSPTDDRYQPTLIEALDVIELLQLDIPVNTIALKVGRIAVEQRALEVSPRELVENAQLMLAKFGVTIHTTAKGLTDQRLDAQERQAIATELDDLIPLLVGIRAAARG